MESQDMERQAATEDRETYMGNTYMDNKRTWEFLVLAGLLGIGVPVAILMGVQAGERTAAVLYPHSESVELAPIGFKGN